MIEQSCTTCSNGIDKQSSSVSSCSSSWILFPNFNELGLGIGLWKKISDQDDNDKDQEH